ncbi:MAG: 2OG-Fe(II) oxygenase [Alphaproteobacteria bacterium]|nr:2OG-Fe(II) oxygenase [Alphaproteobacteria bacterium]
MSVPQDLEYWIDEERHPLSSSAFCDQCRDLLDRDGVLTLDGFIRQDRIASMIGAAEKSAHNAYFTSSTHNVYLTPRDKDLPEDHVFNRQIMSSKGCITTDQVPDETGLHVIYNDPQFQSFIAHVVGQDAVFPYADPLSSINVHYASHGQELGWHFDNSTFAITLLLQAPKAGGSFEYVKDLRDADGGEMNFDGVRAVLDGETQVRKLKIDPGTLVLFRGRNSIHRVTPTEGDRTRILVVLAYNDTPGVALSESARMTFYGRLG